MNHGRRARSDGRSQPRSLVLVAAILLGGGSCPGQLPAPQFKEASGDRCSLGSAAAPVTASDHRGATWLLFDRTRDGVTTAVLRRNDGKVETRFPGARAGALLTNLDGTQLQILLQRDEGIEQRAVEAAQGTAVGSHRIVLGPGATLLDAGSDPKGNLTFLARREATGSTPAELLVVPAQDGTKFGAPLRLAQGQFGRARLAASDGAILFEDADGVLHLVTLDPTQSAWTAVANQPRLDGTRLAAAPTAALHFAATKTHWFLTCVPAGAANAPVLCLTERNRPATAGWSKATLPPGPLLGIAHLEWNLVAALSGTARHGVAYSVFGDSERCFAQSELPQLARNPDVVADLRVGRQDGGGALLALLTRQKDGLQQGQVLALDGLTVVERNPRYAARANGRQALAKKDQRWAAAVDQAIDWLLRHQDADGRWRTAHFMRHDTVGEPCDGAGKPCYDIAITALAALCLLGDGANLHGRRHRDPLERACRWLLSQQAPQTGMIAGNHGYQVYDHALATLALAEACAVSAVSWARPGLTAALAHLESRRNPYCVWRYMPRDNDNSTSVTIWCLWALLAGQDAGIPAPPETLKLCAIWFTQVTEGTGRSGYTKVGEVSSRFAGDHAVRFPVEKNEAMTAAALFGRFLLKEAAVPSDLEVWQQRSAEVLVAKPPLWDAKAGSIDEYAWLLGTMALRYHGGKAWDLWRNKLGLAVLKNQRTDGNFRGSWDPIGVWGEAGGRIYTTAMLCLALQAEHRLTPAPVVKR